MKLYVELAGELAEAEFARTSDQIILKFLKWIVQNESAIYGDIGLRNSGSTSQSVAQFIRKHQSSQTWVWNQSQNENHVG